METINLFNCIILFSGDRYLLPLDFLYKERTYGMWVKTIKLQFDF
ncbi:hypothetical protein [Nostoc sp.]